MVSASTAVSAPYWKRMSLGMIEWDTQFTVRAWNPAAERLFGYSREEMLGRHAKFIVPASEHPRVIQVMQRLQGGEQEVTVRNRNICKDGRLISCEWYNTGLFDARGRLSGYVSLVRDASEQSVLEQQLENEKDLLRGVLRGVPGMFYMLDEAGRFIQWNRQYEEMTGYGGDELARMSIFDLLEGEERTHLRVKLAALLQEGGTSASEFCKITRGGTRLPVYASCAAISRDGKPCIAGVAVDLSARKTVEASLQHSNRELKRRNASLQLLIGLSRKLQREPDLTRIGEEAIAAVAGFGRPPQAGCYLLDDDGRQLRLLAARGRAMAGDECRHPVLLARSPAALAVAQQRPVVLENPADDARLDPGLRRRLASEGIRCLLSVPLLCLDSVLGSIELAYTGSRRFDALDLETLQSIGQNVAMALANARQLASLEHQALHDSLTGLPNRAFLHAECARLRRDETDGGRRFALILFDFDRFKEINDTLGHDAGDELLLRIGERMSAAFSDEPVFLCRLGGDEFALVAELEDGPGEARQLAGRVRRILRHPVNLGDITIEVDASIGMAFYPEQARDSHELLRCAEVAMYQAKHSMSRMVVYERELDPHSPERLALIVELGAAIRQGQLELQYQPRMELGEGRVTGFEALVRWNHPRFGRVAPGRFIPLAETGDLIRALTRLVTDKALASLRVWRDAGMDVSVAINISTRNLLDQGFPDSLERLIRHHGVDPSHVELEITESALIGDPERARASLDQIAALGVVLSIDDFGTGYSSLNYLKRLPVQILKIDRSFVSDMLRDSQDFVIVRSTVNLAHNLGLQVIAEGVEDQATLQTLRGMGCDSVQGYHTGQPLDEDAVASWSDEQRVSRLAGKALRTVPPWPEKTGTGLDG